MIQRAFWDITDECWSAIDAHLHPGMRTLEAGSGRSTVLFERTGCRHVALEHDARYGAGCASVVKAPLVGTPPWYDWTPAHAVDLLFIDGPPGRIGRAGILRVLPQLVHERTVIVIDDTNRRAERRLADHIAATYGLRSEYRRAGLARLRAFTVLTPAAR